MPTRLIGISSLSLSLFPGAKPQIIQTTVRAHVQVELFNARPGSGWISFSQHVAALFGVVNVFQVSIVSNGYQFTPPQCTS